MELRWLIKKNNVTAAEVHAYRMSHNCTMMEAKKALLDETPPVLQYRQGMGFDWEDVPVAVMPHEK